MLYVVMVASECAPAAKAGGLGDMVSGLARELEFRGHAVEIILPKYDRLHHSDIWDLQPSHHDLWVPWYDGAVRCTVWFGSGCAGPAARWPRTWAGWTSRRACTSCTTP
jgi:starch synthase